jgi:hypothetical protein
MFVRSSSPVARKAPSTAILDHKVDMVRFQEVIVWLLLLSYFLQYNLNTFLRFAD